MTLHALLLLLLAGLCSAQDAAPAAAKPSTRLVFNPVERSVIEQRLTAPPRKNEERGQRLRALFEESGCTSERLTQQTVKGSKIPNVICLLPGTSQDTIVVGAHFDHVGGEGVADNWSGASLLPSLVQALSHQPRKHTYVFVGFTDEEKGLVGSRHYVKALTPEERQRLRLMVNLDTLGLDTTRAWHRQADPRLRVALERIADSMKLPLEYVNVDGVGTTDSAPFQEKKVPTIALHSVTAENMKVLHTREDTIKAIKMDAYYQSYRLIAAYLAYLDLFDWSEPAKKD